LGIIAYRKQTGEILWEWIQQNRKLILINEVLFLAAFAGLAIIRAANPRSWGLKNRWNSPSSMLS